MRAGTGAIQQVLRDSFRKETSLESVAFGMRRAAAVRGEAAALAAVISRGEVEYVTPELLAAVRAIEAAHWDHLVVWDGRREGLEDIDVELRRIVSNQFRSPWRVQLG